MKKFIYYALTLAWSASVVGMAQPVPSAPPLEPEERVFVPGAPSAPPAQDLGISAEELRRTQQPPAPSSAQTWEQENVRAYAPSFEQPALPIEQPQAISWYQRYWNATKEIAQTSWSWLRPAAVGAVKGSWALIRMGASGVVNAARRINRKINYD